MSNTQQQLMETVEPVHLSFRLGLQTINTIARRVDPRRPVFELNVKLNRLDRLLRTVFRWPLAWLFRTKAKPCLLAICPRLVIPSVVFLKQSSKGSVGSDAFDTEKEVYNRLENEQGSYIPDLYGQVVCRSKPAILLSKAKGEPLSKLLPGLSREERVPLMESTRATYEQFTNAGIIPGDVENMLDHVFYDGKRAMLIDFDAALLGEESQLVRSVNDADYEDFESRVRQIS